MNPMNEKKPGDQLLQDDVSAKRTEELSAYEMTEVRIKLEGKFSSFSAEDMNGAGKDMEVVKVNLAMQKNETPLKAETKKIELPEKPGENWENMKISTVETDMTPAAAVVLPETPGKLPVCQPETAENADGIRKMQVPAVSLKYESAAIQVEKSAAVLPESGKIPETVQKYTVSADTESQKLDLPDVRKFPTVEMNRENKAEIQISLPHIDTVGMKITGNTESGAVIESVVLPESRSLRTEALAVPETDVQAVLASDTENRIPEKKEALRFTGAGLEEFVKGTLMMLTGEEQKAALQAIGSLPEIHMAAPETAVSADIPESPLKDAVQMPAIPDMGDGLDVSAMRVDRIPDTDPVIRRILELAESVPAPAGLTYEEMCRRCAVPEMKLEYSTAIGDIMNMLQADKKSGELTVQ